MKKLTLILFLLFVYYIPQTVYADTLNSLLSINFNGGIGFPWGKLMTEEEDAIKVSVEYSDGTTKDGKLEHLTLNYGISLDILPFTPAISSSFTSASKLGFRVKYNWNIVDQSISIGGEGYEQKNWSGNLITYNSLLGGIVYYYAPSLISDTSDPANKKYSSNYLISVYALLGKVLNGEITPYPIAQKEMYGTNLTFGITGYKMEIGAGFEFSGGSPFHLGGNLFYSYTKIKTDEKLYNAGTDLYYSEVTFEVYAGLSI